MKIGLLVTLLVLFAAPSFPQDCGCETSQLPDVVLILNGTKYRQADVFSVQARQKITDLQQSVIDERKNELQLLLNAKLLTAEARKQGMSPTRLIKQEVVSKVTDPNETEIQEFYSRNRSSIAGDLIAARADIIAYIRNKRETAAADEYAQRLRAAADVKVLIDEAAPPANASQRSRVLATINGAAVTAGDVEDALRPTIFSVQEQVYDIRKGEIDRKLNDLLLTGEARKRGLTEQALYEAEVTKKVPAVGEAEARAFFDKNRERITGDFEKVRYQLINYLVDQKKNDVEKGFADRLRAAATVQTFLSEPIEPIYAIDSEGRPSKGARNAPVTIVEFIDIECRTCAEPYHVLDRIFNESNGKVRIVAMHYPLSQHKNAANAAIAAEAAREQGKFFEYVDLLFKDQSALELTGLKQYATQLGLDRKKFDAALDGTRLSDIVDHDRLEGDKIGVSRTPTIFINGRRSADITYEGLKKAVDAALRK
jgi:protein-disulfide isomerase